MWATGAYGYLSDYLLWGAVVISIFIHTWCFFRLTRGTQRLKLRLIGGNTLVGFCLLAVAAMTAETYLRFVSISTDAYGASLTTKRWQKAFTRLNSTFCRDEEWSEAKPAGVYRIAFVGDSFTYGWGINDEADRFTELLQQRFKAARQPVEVMNVAWGGWDTKDHTWAVREFLWRYAVDEVVLCYLPNDIASVMSEGSDADPRQPLEPVYVNIESSFLIDYLYHRVVAPRLRAGTPYLDWLADAYADPTIWAKQQEALAEFVRECRERNYGVRAALLPFIRTGGSRFDAQAIHKQVGEYFRFLDVPVVDLLPAIAEEDPSNLMVNNFDPHPDGTAHRLFAEAIWQGFYDARAANAPTRGPGG